MKETPKALQAVKESETSSNDSNTGIAKYKFSDLKDGETLDVKPIFYYNLSDGSGKKFNEIL